ncbi:hypothetical protein [Brevibacillus fulvus]|uniref:Uncharacterized protein n=1 Tax=Brevibacillus fulvus TaxID=1125967 RepID=A0A938XZC9_9BACL|nr:hypothetical protein [Brevibacillus fulvus]MBM7590561.1 hypothetical protein [Brevibacillus fulvus]
MKSFYYEVNWSDAKKYTDALHALEIPYTVETSIEIPTLPEGQLAIVFPSLPIRIYVKVRTLFGRDGNPY